MTGINSKDSFAGERRVPYQHGSAQTTQRNSFSTHNADLCSETQFLVSHAPSAVSSPSNTTCRPNPPAGSCSNSGHATVKVTSASPLPTRAARDGDAAIELNEDAMPAQCLRSHTTDCA